MNRVDHSFSVMGCQARIRLESVTRSQTQLDGFANEIESLFHRYDHTLSRFRVGSELTRFNERHEVCFPGSVFLQELALHARWAGLISEGLVDATLIDELQKQGYRSSLADKKPDDLVQALLSAPVRQPAQPSRESRFTQLSVNSQGEVCAPLGVQLDSGGLGKGLIVDRAAAMLPSGVRFVISCGGDLAVGGGIKTPWQVVVADAHDSSQEVHRLTLHKGGIATSGVNTRIWQNADGSYGHHLLNPETGQPAWTGLLTVTAVASNTVEAEVLAKTAFLQGPRGAKRLLRKCGGVLQHEDGRVEVVGNVKLLVKTGDHMTIRQTTKPIGRVLHENT